jgi:hypothetical protein
VERLPSWGIVMAALTVAVAALAALGAVPTPLLIVPFVGTTLARRFAVTAIRAEINDDGLWLGEALAASRAEITDVWFDADDRELRVTVASKPDRLLVIHLPNAQQARRFVRVLLPEPHEHRVAGVRPRLLHLLVPLRFLAVAIAFWVTSGSPVAALLALLFAVGAHGYVIGTQIDAGEGALELRTLRGTTRIAYADIASIEIDAGSIRLRSERTVALPARVVREPLAGTSAFTRRAHARALAHLAERVRAARGG